MDRYLDVLRAELRAAGITYKMLADRIAMSESSIKRMFGQKDMTLSRLAQICQAAGVNMEDVLRRAADARPQADTLTLPAATEPVLRYASVPNAASSTATPTSTGHRSALPTG